MNARDVMDGSWDPIRGLLSQEPLSLLPRQVLPNISYQPKKENIFRVFSMPVNNVRVIILGMDPYPTPGNAIGRAFAVSENTKVPASLRIIYKEIEDEGLINRRLGSNLFNINNPKWKTLEHWSDQGVFLLNTALTVETGKAGSHLHYWENFTKRVISFISIEQPCIWVMWGRKAQSFIPNIRNPYPVKGYDRETIKNIPADPDLNYVLTAPHPAAEAYAGGNAGFYGCDHFLFVNEILKRVRRKTINW